MSAFKYQNKSERKKRSHCIGSTKGKVHLRSQNLRIEYIGKGCVIYIVIQARKRGNIFF